MADAGGSLWNIGGGYGYRPYSLMELGARRIAGLGAVPSPSGDVAEGARQAAAQALALLRTLPADQRAAAVRRLANTLRGFGGAELVRKLAKLRTDAGASPEYALESAFAYIIQKEFEEMAATGRTPSWVPNGASGFGADDWTKLVTGDNVKAATGVIATIGCIFNSASCPKAPVTTVTNVGGGATTTSSIPGWVLPVAIGGGVLFLGTIVLVALKK